MSQSLQNYTGKEVVITAMNTRIIGTVMAVEDQWVILQPQGGQPGETEMINMDYISRIQDHPRTKSGKKKSFFS